MLYRSHEVDVDIADSTSLRISGIELGLQRVSHRHVLRCLCLLDNIDFGALFDFVKFRCGVQVVS